MARQRRGFQIGLAFKLIDLAAYNRHLTSDIVAAEFGIKRDSALRWLMELEKHIPIHVAMEQVLDRGGQHYVFMASPEWRRKYRAAFTK